MVISRFRAHLESTDRSPSTVRLRVRDVEAFAAWFAGRTGRDFDPIAVTPPDVRDYRAWLQTTQGQKPNSVNRALNSLSVFFGWARDEQLVASNPCASVRPVEQQPAPPRWLTRPEQAALRRTLQEAAQRAELKALLAEEPRHPALVRARRDLALVSLMLDAGLRVGEVCGLCLDDVALNERSGKVIVRFGKRKYREVPLNAGARKALREWLNVRPEVDFDNVLVGRDRKPLHARGVQRLLARYARKAGIEELTPHALRHTFAKNLVDAGRPLTEVAALLGHARLETTRVYTRPGAEDLARAVAAVDWEE